jgi:D-aminopeptidase
MAAFMESANTTIAIVATDMVMDKAQCQRVAIASHDGICRAIIPAHMPGDGDAVFALSTGEIKMQNPTFDLMMIGHAAALCLSRAIARAVFEATPAQNDLLPCWRDLNTAKDTS